MMRPLLRTCACILVLTAAMCPDKGPEFVGPSAKAPHTGNLTGAVFTGTIPRSGAVVSLAGVADKSSTTDASGVFKLMDLQVGSYTIQTVLPGLTCPPVPVEIILDKTTTVDVQCTVNP